MPSWGGAPWGIEMSDLKIEGYDLVKISERVEPRRVLIGPADPETGERKEYVHHYPEPVIIVTVDDGETRTEYLAIKRAP